ncbi:MAG: fluoride efflux transporter CrcB [Planctomycetaceae bacterium]
MPDWLANWLAVGVGGCVGAIARFQISQTLSAWSEARYGRVWPFGTFAVNILGCLAIGILMTLVMEKSLSDRVRLIWITGCFGSLTTFSAFGFETVLLIRDGRSVLGVANVAANLLFGLVAVLIGIGLARQFVRA